MSVQELAAQAEVTRHAVDPVARHREADRGEVHADLMRAPGLQAHLEERPPGQRLPQLEPGDGVPRRRRVERVARAVAPVATDGCFDPPRAGAGLPDDERQVTTFHVAPPHGVLQEAVGLLRAGHQHQARGIAVETVDDTGPAGLPTPRAERQQPVHQRALPCRPGRMDDHAGRLVHHEQVLVLVDDCDLQFFRHQRRLVLEHDHDIVARRHTVALRARLAADARAAGRDQALCKRPRRDLGPGGEDAVEALAGGGLRDAKAEPCQRARSCDRPRRRRRRAGPPPAR